jgi:3-methylcrotonyl-CoA carboxylase beta subunit
MNNEFNKFEDGNKLKVSALNQRLQRIYLGGGKKKIDDTHSKGKLTARERVDYLIDKNTSFFEIGAFAAEGMYEEHGGCPSAGVVTGLGYVEGRLCMIVANDATVKAGAWFPNDREKKFKSTRNCYGKPHSNYIFG